MECEDANRIFEKVVTTSRDDFKKSGVDESVFEEFRAVSYPVRTSTCLSAPYSILSVRSPYYYHNLSSMNCISVAYRIKWYSQEALRRFCRRGSQEIADLARVWARLAAGEERVSSKPVELALRGIFKPFCLLSPVCRW